MDRKLYRIATNTDEYTREDVLNAIDTNRDIIYSDGCGVCELYVNLDANCGFQFVSNWWSPDDIGHAAHVARGDSRVFWDTLTDCAHQLLTDIEDDDDVAAASDWAVELMCDADIVATVDTLFTDENMRAMIVLAEDLAREQEV